MKVHHLSKLSRSMMMPEPIMLTAVHTISCVTPTFLQSLEENTPWIYMYKNNTQQIINLKDNYGLFNYTEMNLSVFQLDPIRSEHAHSHATKLYTF